jgi:hypothetical protein
VQQRVLQHNHPNSGQILRRSEMTRCANSGHRTLGLK